MYLCSRIVLLLSSFVLLLTPPSSSFLLLLLLLLKKRTNRQPRRESPLAFSPRGSWVEQWGSWTLNCLLPIRKSNDPKRTWRWKTHSVGVAARWNGLCKSRTAIPTSNGHLCTLYSASKSPCSSRIQYIRWRTGSTNGLTGFRDSTVLCAWIRQLGSTSVRRFDPYKYCSRARWRQPWLLGQQRPWGPTQLYGSEWLLWDAPGASPGHCYNVGHSAGLFCTHSYDIISKLFACSRPSPVW